MTRRAWLQLVVLIVVMAALGWHSVMPRDRLFDFDRDAAVQLRLVEGAQQLDLVRKDGVWRISNMGDVAASPARVADLLQALVSAQRGPDKSGDPAYFNQLGLGDAGLLLSALDGAGRPLAELQLGKPAAELQGARFARLRGEGPSFLVQGFAEVMPGDPAWLADPLPMLEPVRLSSMSLVAPSLVRTELRRQADGRWTRRDGRTTDEAFAALLAEAVASPPVAQIRAAESINWFNAQTILAQTADGLMLAGQAKAADGKIWLRPGGFALAGAPADVAARARAINAQRFVAFAIPGDHGAALLARGDRTLLARR